MMSKQKQKNPWDMLKIDKGIDQFMTPMRSEDLEDSLENSGGGSPSREDVPALISPDGTVKVRSQDLVDKVAKVQPEISAQMPTRMANQSSDAQLEEKIRENLEERKGGIKGMEKQIEDLKGKSYGFQGVDLSAGLAFADSLNGSNTAQSYKAPQDKFRDQETIAKLQQAIQKESSGINDDMIAVLKEKANTDRYKSMFQSRSDKAANSEQNFDIKNEFKLREKWESHTVTKASQSMDDHYRKITGVDTLTPQGQMSMVFSFMKMLDDGSVVRESEFANAAKTQGLEAQAENYLAKLQSGQILTQQQISQFQKVAGDIIGEVRQKQGALDVQYKRMAGEYGLNPDRVVYGVSFGDQQKKAVAPQASAPGGQAPVMSPQDWLQQKRSMK